jgi:hypothetical protein
MTLLPSSGISAVSNWTSGLDLFDSITCTPRLSGLYPATTDTSSALTPSSPRAPPSLLHHHELRPHFSITASFALTPPSLRPLSLLHRHHELHLHFIFKTSSAFTSPSPQAPPSVNTPRPLLAPQLHRPLGSCFTLTGIHPIKYSCWHNMHAQEGFMLTLRVVLKTKRPSSS